MYYVNYLLGADPEAIRKQRAAIELMLRQSCLPVKPTYEECTERLRWSSVHKTSMADRSIDIEALLVSNSVRRRATYGACGASHLHKKA